MSAGLTSPPPLPAHAYQCGLCLRVAVRLVVELAVRQEPLLLRQRLRLRRPVGPCCWQLLWPGGAPGQRGRCTPSSPKVFGSPVRKCVEVLTWENFCQAPAAATSPSAPVARCFLSLSLSLSCAFFCAHVHMRRRRTHTHTHTHTRTGSGAFLCNSRFPVMGSTRRIEVQIRYCACT